MSQKDSAHPRKIVLSQEAKMALAGLPKDVQERFMKQFAEIADGPLPEDAKEGDVFLATADKEGNIIHKAMRATPEQVARIQPALDAAMKTDTDKPDA